MASTTNVFEVALARFKSRLNAKEMNEFSNLTTLNDLKRSIQSIQKSQEAKKDMMNLTRIQRFLEGMEQLGKVVDVFLNTSEILAFVWGPMKFLLLTASVWVESFDELLGAYESIGQCLPLLATYGSLFRGDNHIQEVLGLVYEDILKFHAAALRFFSRPAWRQVFRSMWKDFGATFQAIIDSLKQHKDLVDRLASALHMAQSQKDSQALHTFIGTYANDVTEMRAYMLQHKVIQDKLWKAAQEAEDKRMRDNKQEVLVWVAATSMSDLHERFCQDRQDCPDSGNWVFSKEKLKHWKDSDTPNNSLLWLHGVPGAGKTILASKIVEICTRNTEFKTTYFYCREGDVTTTTCEGILRGLIAQMINHDESLVQFCLEKKKTISDVVLKTEDMAKKLLEIFCKSIPKQFIIIDGLDECDQRERGRFLNIINSIVKVCDETSSLGKPRVLFISRKLGDIEKSLANASHMEIASNDMNEDIEAFVIQRTEHLRAKFDDGQDSHLTEEVQRLTMVYADGMFLFAYLVMENLNRCYDRKSFIKEARQSTFPKKIGEAYDRILSRLRDDENNWGMTCRLLGWLVSAKRPLKMYELQAVLSIELREKRMEYEDNKLRVHITDCCGSLVQMVGDNRVQLVHHTAREFVIKSKYVNEYAVQCDMAVLCLQYLTFDCFSTNGISDDQVSEHIRRGEMSFQDYAASKWSHHLQTLIERCGKFLSGRDGREAQQQLFEALDEFSAFYQESLCIKEKNADEWKRLAAEDCEAYQDLPLFEHLRDLWTHVRIHQQTLDVKERDKIGLIPELSKAVERNRKAMEGFAADPKVFPQSEVYYGRNHFKCPRLTCPYFYEGFKNSTDRDKHLKKHDRPFECVIDTCDYKIFGFVSNPQLEKHMRSYHPEICDTSTSEFRFAALNQRKVEKTKFTCPECKKNFTRNINLKAHLDSHNGLKPFGCPECGKAFTRKNDMVRHQRIHSRAHRGV